MFLICQNTCCSHYKHKFHLYYARRFFHSNLTNDELDKFRACFTLILYEMYTNMMYTFKMHKIKIYCSKFTAIFSSLYIVYRLLLDNTFNWNKY